MGVMMDHVQLIPDNFVNSGAKIANAVPIKNTHKYLSLLSHNWGNVCTYVCMYVCVEMLNFVRCQSAPEKSFILASRRFMILTFF